MKTSYCSLALLLACWLFAAANLTAQSTNFQRLYGTNLKNSFTKTLRSGTSYYVLGRDEPTAGALNRATVTRLDAQGQHQWTLRLDIASQWNDAVVTPDGNLLLVGNTLPFDANCQSLAAVVTATGAFSWVRSYNVPGRETFNRVVRNPSPDNGAFPYYILGTQWDPAGNATWDDVVLLTVSEAGNFGWKKRYTGLFGTTDDEFARDLEALPNGDLILAGNWATTGVIFRADNTGAIFNGVSPDIQFSFADVAQTSGGFLSVGHTFPSVSAFLMKFDSDLLPQWQLSLPDLTAVSQVWRDGDDGIYVTGRATVAGLNRDVVLKFQDFGNDPAPLTWMKYLDNQEVAYTGGSSWHLPPSQLAYNVTDGRNTSDRAFLSVSDLDMSTCMTEAAFPTILASNHLFASPCCLDIEFVDVPMGTNVTVSSAVDWGEEDACPSCSCDDIYFDVVQVPDTSDTCEFGLAVTNVGANCFDEINLALSAGAFDEIIPADGWDVVVIDSQQVRLTSIGGDWTTFVFHKGKLRNVSMFEMTVSTSYHVGQGTVVCERVFELACPPPPPPLPCCPAGSTFGTEQVQNGDFELGNVGFTNGYPYFLPGTPGMIGSYSVLDAAQVVAANTQWAGVEHTAASPTGRMLVVDGFNGSFIAWQQTVTVVAGQTYAFSAWFNNLVRPPIDHDNPIMALWVGNTQVAGPLNLSETPDEWMRLCGVYTAAATGSVALSIRFQSITTIGNDVAIDDVSFKACLPPPPCGVSIAATPTPFCGTGTLTAIPTGLGPFSFQWCQSQTTQSINVQGMPCGTVCTVTVTCADATTSTASFIPSDIVPPTALCNPGIGVDLDPITCTFSMTPAFVDGGSFDDCQIQSMTVSPSVLTGCGDHTVTLTVTDWCGNTSTCTMGVQTIDVVPPDINCPANLTVEGYLDPAGICKNQVTGIAPQASDNCGLLGVVYSLNNGNPILLPDASGATFSQGTTTVTYLATDICQNTASCTFTVTVTCEDCECYTMGGAGAELLLNGDFDGSGGFSSGYVNNCTNQLEGQYCITTNAATVNAGFEPCTDPTGAGNIFVANGSVTPSTDVLSYIIPVAQNTEYLFSFYHASVTGASPAHLVVYIDGVPTGPIAQGPLNPCVWRKHCVRWNSGGKTAITLSIQNLNTQAQGNDFAIDKVSFKACRNCAPLPSPANAVLWMPMDELGGENTIQSIVNGLAAIPNTHIGLGGPNPESGVVDFQGFSFGALCFAGPTPASHATVSHDPSLNFGAGSFTIDAWIKTSLNTQSAPIVSKRDGNGNGYAFYIAGNPSASHLMLDIGNLQFQGPQIALGQWNFVAVAVEPPNVTFYIGDAPGSGVTFSSVSLPINGTTNASSSSPLLIGKNTQNTHWTICMDELEIFKTALSAAEIQSIWASGVEGKCRSVCTCGGFSKLAIRNKKGGLNKFLSCGNQPESLPCVPGQGYHLTGVFHCDGGECAPEHEIRWTLSGPGGTQSGSFIDNDPFFGIHLLPNWFGTPGAYTLTLSGDCGAEACTCVVKFDVNCPNLCPCDESDRDAFQQNAAKGFATAVSLKTCKACFSPLALSDCESVDWWLNGIGATYLGSTVGKQTLCYAFPQPGMYTIVMDVVRTMPDGSLCDLYTYTQTVTLSCTDVTECTGSVLPNADFSTDPVPGDLGDSGMAPGWSKVEHSGDPHEVILLETGDSQDGWAMALTGSYFGAGVLGSAEPLCVSKSDTGTLTMTLRSPGDPIPGIMIKVGRKPPGGLNNIILYTGNTTPWPNCQDASCYSLAVLEDLLPFDDDDWYELRIPYNLSDWAALDSCGDFAGGIPARMAVFVSNFLSEEQQSAGPVRDAILIDNICFRGMTVSAKELALSRGLRLYPNPTTNSFTLELPAPAPSGTTIRITDPTGRLALEATAEVGSERQQVQTGALPAGLYFVQVLQSGRVVGVSRFVKQ